MNRFRLLRQLFTLLGSLVVVQVAAANGSLIYGNISGWTVYTDPAQQYRCFAEADYGEGTALRIGYNNAAAQLYLSIADAGLIGGNSAERRLVEVRFDDATVRTFDVVAEGSTAETLVLAIPRAEQEPFLADFSRQFAISIRLDNDAEPLMLSLGGSLGATRMLRDCHASMAQVRAANDR